MLTGHKEPGQGCWQSEKTNFIRALGEKLQHGCKVKREDKVIRGERLECD
jgi:hypothetical protein